MDQVSREQHRLELEQRTISQGIRASQELSLLQVAMERSLSSAEVAAADDSEVARIPPPPPEISAVDLAIATKISTHDTHDVIYKIA